MIDWLIFICTSWGAQIVARHVPVVYPPMFMSIHLLSYLYNYLCYIIFNINFDVYSISTVQMHDCTIVTQWELGHNGLLVNYNQAHRSIVLTEILAHLWYSKHGFMPGLYMYYLMVGVTQRTSEIIWGCVLSVIYRSIWYTVKECGHFPFRQNVI